MKLDQEIVFERLTREQIKDYCEASGDHNRIHWDTEFAKSAGLPDIIGHGMLSMGLLGVALEKWGYPSSTLKSFDAKFKEMAKPGDQLIASCLNYQSAKKEGTLSLSLKNASGVEICTATVKLLPH